ncbi:MAG: hypothetical protein F6K41_04470 [Symploca sp. SIO3E6]|nr:hypothetical protein [Caldora sp. SIO3E6]
MLKPSPVNLLPSDLKETRGRGDAGTRREIFSCMVVKKIFFHWDCLLPSALCLLLYLLVTRSRCTALGQN